MGKMERLAIGLMDDAQLYAPALYCGFCPLKPLCGGIHCKASPLSCDEFCCGGLEGCTTVCRKHSDFLAQFAETGGLDLASLPEIPGPPVDLTAQIVPLIYHGSKRAKSFSEGNVSIRLGDLIDFKAKRARFADRAALCDAFKISVSTKIVVTGVDHDPSIERVWALGRHRATIFKDIATLGFSCVTTPNFSMILDVPRMDNMHAMQRIGILYCEMSEAGLPAALHINGRTDRDFERWSNFVSCRPYIGAISYEFITGSGLVSRLDRHLEWINSVIEEAGRPLRCILRGNPACLDKLHANAVPIYIETTSFVKSVKRQIPTRYGNQGLKWRTDPLIPRNDISAVLDANFLEVRKSLLSRYSAFATRQPDE
jgi:Domain of unknown function (DUF4417)